jgi:LuxR family maltose regulon positive regulatory protein
LSKTADAAWAEVRPYKFYAPVAYAGVIRRARLLDRVAASPGAGVVLLQGPAGHGKTTALQQLKELQEAEGRVTAWLTFDQGDNDPRRFTAQMKAFLDDLAVRAGMDEAKTARSPRQRHRRDWLVASLAAFTRPVALFFDEFHALTERSALEQFKLLFETASDRVRVFIGSRSLPDVGLARLVVNNRALILHGDDLRFTPKEVEEFFASAGDLGIDLDEVDAIYQRTEGWPAALQLFRLTLGSPHVRKSLGKENLRPPRELAEYLAENVLALQPPRIQEFLLQTSKLTRLSAALCDEVLGWNDSRDILVHLERSGMFLRCVDPQLGWYKYHTLFSSILAEQLRNESTDGADEVHRRAAHWYMRNGHFEEAVLHATTCREYDLAADALNRWASRLVAYAHLQTLEQWSERLPYEKIASRRDLAIKVAYALVFLRRRQRARPLLDLLRADVDSGTVASTTNARIVLSMAAMLDNDVQGAYELSEQVPMHDTELTGFPAFELGASSNLRAYCALIRQEYVLARDYLSQARIYNDHVNAPFSRGYTAAVATVALVMQGHLREALARLRDETSDSVDEPDRSVAAAVSVAAQVWALYEANELAAAETLFTQHREVIASSTRFDFLVVAYMSAARLYEALGRPGHAETLLDEVEAIGRENGWAPLVCTVKWERVRRVLLQDSVDEAIAIAATARYEPELPEDWISIGSDVESRELGEIRLAIAVRDLAEAHARIDHEFRRQRGRVLRQVKLHLMAALVASRSGDEAGARRHVRTALGVARPGGYVRVFLDEGAEVLALLQQELQHLSENHRRPPADPEREFIETLLEAAGAAPEATPGQFTTALPVLTDREREMLALLANGISNKGIANRLFVSENTVKFHLKNIYAKLGVTSRVQAVSAARQMGIVG